MLNTSGLSIDKAPPIAAPFTFFLMAPLFGLAAGLLLTTHGETVLLSRWTPVALALTHLVALGFVTSIMIGALVQITPVLFGAAPRHSLAVSRIAAVGLAVGVLNLATGLQQSSGIWLLGAASILGPTLTLLPLLLFTTLARAEGDRGSRFTLQLSLVALAVTAIIGVTLALGRAGLGWSGMPPRELWINAHLLWGFIGWMGLLLVAVGSELMPMFYLSPPLPLRSGPAAGLVVLAALIPMTLWVLFGGAATVLVPAAAALLAVVILFAAAALWQSLRRKRRVVDVTLAFWWLGHLSVIGAGNAWMADSPVLAGLFALGGAGMSYTSGALYKIVPFLCWLHLRRKQVETRRTDIKVPMMKIYISETQARAQFASHAVALGLLVAASLFDVPTARAGGLLLTLASGLLWTALLRAWLHLRRLERAMGRPRDDGEAKPQPRV